MDPLIILSSLSSNGSSGNCTTGIWNTTTGDCIDLSTLLALPSDNTEGSLGSLIVAVIFSVFVTAFTGWQLITHRKDRLVQTVVFFLFCAAELLGLFLHRAYNQVIDGTNACDALADNEFYHQDGLFCESQMHVIQNIFGHCSKTEIANSISNIGYMLAGCFGFVMNGGADPLVQLQCAMLFATGVGSLAYHISGFKGTGLFDGPPMLFVVTFSAIALCDLLIGTRICRQRKVAQSCVTTLRCNCFDFCKTHCDPKDPEVERRCIGAWMGIVYGLLICWLLFTLEQNALHTAVIHGAFEYFFMITVVLVVLLLWIVMGNDCVWMGDITGDYTWGNRCCQPCECSTECCGGRCLPCSRAWCLYCGVINDRCQRGWTLCCPECCKAEVKDETAKMILKLTVDGNVKPDASVLVKIEIGLIIIRACFAIGLGYALQWADNNRCSSYAVWWVFLFLGHPVWHLLSAYAGLSLIVVTGYLRLLNLDYSPQIQYWGFGLKLCPYIERGKKNSEIAATDATDVAAAETEVQKILKDKTDEAYKTGDVYDLGFQRSLAIVQRSIVQRPMQQAPVVTVVNDATPLPPSLALSSNNAGSHEGTNGQPQATASVPLPGYPVPSQSLGDDADDVTYVVDLNSNRPPASATTSRSSSPYPSPLPRVHSLSAHNSTTATSDDA